MDIKKYIQNSINTKEAILNDNSVLERITDIADVIIEALKNDKKLLVAGNGGSAADAQHIAAEFVSKFFFDRRGLSAIALTTDTSVLTAVGNDYGYEKTFARQIQALAKEGDIFLAVSTSGNSRNIIFALEEAKKQNIQTVGLTGLTPCEMDKFCDYIIHVPSDSTPTIQEAHIMIAHIICGLVEENIFRDIDTIGTNI